MINVEFFGLYRLDYKTDKWQTEASTVGELFEKVADNFDGHSAKDLRNSVVFVNGVSFVKLKMYRTKLKDGDNVLIMSPASGG